MKIRADEHVSPRIIKAIQLICLRKEYELSHVRDSHGPRTSDETWLPRFAEEGGVAIFSADSKMLKRPHQLVAVRDAGLACIILSSEWSHAKRHEQAANVLWWWPRIEDVVANCKAGDCWLVPYRFDRSTGLTSKKIDYDKAARAVKR